MGKRKCWLSFVRSLFVSEPKLKTEKKSKCTWRWLFGGQKSKKYQTIAAPDKIINGAREEQRKHAMAVALATAAAAEAAVAAVRAAVEVVQLTGVPQSYKECRRVRNLAATKIQAAYRGHLARKALKALKGLVRLQALVRGRIVRRRVITVLKCLPPVSKTKSRVSDTRIPAVDMTSQESEKDHFLCSKGEEYEENENKLRSRSRRNWDYSLFSKEDLDDMWLRKQDATTKRERMKKYSHSHRERRDDQIGGRDSSSRIALLNLKSKIQPNVASSGVSDAMEFELRSEDLVEEMNSSQYILRPRRSFSHPEEQSFGDETCLPNSPSFPTYMAATESAMAKTRSMSTPRQRGQLLDPYSDYGYKLGISSWSSFNGKVAGRRM